MGKSKIENMEQRLQEILKHRKEELQALEESGAADEARFQEAQNAFDQISANTDFEEFERVSEEKRKADIRREWRKRRKDALERKPMISRSEADELMAGVIEEAKRINKANQVKFADHLEKMVEIEKENTAMLSRVDALIATMETEVLHNYKQIYSMQQENIIRDFLQPIMSKDHASGRNVLSALRK